MKRLISFCYIFSVLRALWLLAMYLREKIYDSVIDFSLSYIHYRERSQSGCRQLVLRNAMFRETPEMVHVGQRGND